MQCHQLKTFRVDRVFRAGGVDYQGQDTLIYSLNILNLIICNRGRRCSMDTYIHTYIYIHTYKQTFDRDLMGEVDLAVHLCSMGLAAGMPCSSTSCKSSLTKVRSR